MVMEIFREIKRMGNKTFGPPGEALQTLKAVSEALTSLDERKLRLVKSVLELVGKVKGSPEELQMILDLIRVIASASIEQLTAIRDITANLVKLARLMPTGLKELPIKEIIAEVRKGG